MSQEYSEDGVNWTKHPTTATAYERTIDNFEKGWNKESIGTLLKQGAAINSRIEYSVDDGYSFVPFRLSDYAAENAARIYTMLQRNYQVRSLKITQIGKPKVKATAGMSFFNSVNQAEAQQANKTPRIQTTTATVYRHKEGAYGFTESGLHLIQRQHPDVIDIMEVDRKVVFDMNTPNYNVERMSLEGQKRNAAQLRVRGFVFRFYTHDYSGVQHWWPVLKAANPQLNPAEFMVIKCARVFDAEMDQFFDQLGPTMAVLGGKYVVGWRNRFKFGDTWLAPIQFRDQIEKRIRAKGGAIQVAEVVPNIETKKEEIRFDAEEVNPKYIMQIKTHLKELIQVGSNEDIMDNLLKVIDFRNKCVDELKDLNKVIEEARDKVKGNISHG